MKIKEKIIEFLLNLEQRFYNIFIYAGDDEYRARMKDVGWFRTE